jgi:hypothetical protein
LRLGCVEPAGIPTQVVNEALATKLRGQLYDSFAVQAARMSGKSCFDIKKNDPELLAAVAEMLERGRGYTWAPPD